MKITKLLILLSFSFLSFTCNKGGGSKSAITIEGFYTTDYNGNLVAQVGPADNDWTFTTGLSKKEMDLFGFYTGPYPDNDNLSTLSNRVTAYPNPANAAQNYLFPLKDSTLLKMVIVDASLKIIKTIATGATGGSSIVGLNTSDRTLYPDHSSFRVYYSLSVKGHPDFLTGFGDIRICESTNAANCW